MTAPKAEPWRVPGFRLAHYGGVIYRRGERLWLQFYERGTGGRRGRMRRISAAEYLHIPPAEMSLQKAKAALEELIQRSLGGGAPTLSPREARSRTVNDLLDAYLVAYAAKTPSDRQDRVAGYRKDLNVIRPWVGALAVGAVTEAVLTDVAAKMRARGLADGAVYAYFLRIKACLRWAKRKGLLPVLPEFPELPAGAAREHVIETDDFTRLRGGFPQHHAEAATALYLTGCRKREVLELEWDRVDFDRNEITLRARDTKKRKPRIIPMLPPLRALLLARRKASPVGSRLVFTLPNGRPIGLDAFGAAWRRARRRTGVTAGAPRPHDLRRTAYDRLLPTMPLEEARNLMGHSRAMAERYTIVLAPRLHAASQKYAASARGRSEAALLDGLDSAPRRLAAVKGGRA